MNSGSGTGESEPPGGEVVSETPAERRKRMNMERMRRNRKNPIYRAEEQRRQRERRRQKLGVTKPMPRSTRRLEDAASLHAEGTSHAVADSMGWPTAQVHPIREMDTRAAFPPQETAVVDIPTVDGCPVLPSVVTLSVFAPVPSNITLVVVAGDSVKPQCTAVPVIPRVPSPPAPEVQLAAYMERNLNLGAQGDFWYSTETHQHAHRNLLSNETVVKREM